VTDDTTVLPITRAVRAKRVCVLVMDDNRDTALTLGILLRSEGYEVLLSSTGAEALKEAERMRPDVVLLDIEMPDRNGFDIAQDLVRRYGEKCPVLIAVTGRKTAEDRQTAEISGFHHFVAKPYDPEALIALLASVEPV
jgi:CheY-like chemotaxis protein